MKTKNKMLALVEIAVVLCSVFLMAIPAIAAEQTPQKVSTSANAITTASEDDFVLGVYGNANEDDTIDMRDLTYVKLIFFGKKPETELADAKYDDKINPLDFIQIKLIIVGKEKEITVVDSADRTVTVKKPIERIVTLSSYPVEAIRMCRAQGKIVGIDYYTAAKEIYFPELSKLPSVGSAHYPDLEAILYLNPDLVITLAYPSYVTIDEKLPESIPVVGFYLYKPETMIEDVLKLGYILDKREEAKHYIDDFHNEYVDFLKARTEGLSEEEKPKVYVEAQYAELTTYGAKSAAQQFIDICGGRNIFADIPKGTIKEVDPEMIVVRNPDIIIRVIKRDDAGYEYDVDDLSKIKALRESIVNRSGWDCIAAVKNGKVYIIDIDLQWGLDYPIAISYWAKWIQPDLFEDLDPQTIHQEFLTEFQGLDYDLDKHGVFVYPPLKD